MTSGPRPSSAWLSAVAVLVTLATLTLLAVSGAVQEVPPELGPRVQSWTLFAAVVVMTLVGLRIVIHDPRHSTGWPLLAIGASLVASSFAGPYAATGLPAWVQHLGGFGWFAAFGALLWLLMVMPTGRLLGPGWRVPAGALVAAMVVLSVSGLTAPTIPPSELTNPLSAPSVFTVAAPARRFLVPPLAIIAVVGGIASLVVRFHRSVGTERQQVKWLLFGGALLGLGLALGTLAGVIGAGTAAAAVGLGVAALPTCCGIAILRHGLFDIDRVISRTVAYAVITALLAGVYVGSVAGLRSLLAPFTGEGDLAVAASTLLVAALFGPVRRRVKAAVDRRFDRAHYDAARAVEAFGQRLRDELDIDEVTDDLQRTVIGTLAPARVSLWFPEANP